MDKKRKVVAAVIAVALIGLATLVRLNVGSGIDDETVQAVREALEEAEKDAAANPALPPPPDPSQMTLGKSRMKQ